MSQTSAGTVEVTVDVGSVYVVGDGTDADALPGLSATPALEKAIITPIAAIFGT
jgi:hypothetical protein